MQRTTQGSGPSVNNPSVACPRYLTWAIKALDRCGLNPERDCSSPLEITLVGKTQEGKTSLAISMLGVERNLRERVRGILRSGREPGKSATFCATVYKPDCDGSPEKVLAKLKRDLESLKERFVDDPSKPIALYIPVPVTASPIVVIDLVGLDSSDSEEECRRANRITEYWLSRADLIIYTSGSDHISDLLPWDPEVDRFMRRWRISPDTCGIVLTKAYELADFRSTVTKVIGPEQLHRLAVEFYREKIQLQVAHRLGSDRGIALPRLIPVRLKVLSDESAYTRLSEEATELALEGIREYTRQNPVLLRVKSAFAVPAIKKRELLERKKEVKDLLENVQRQLLDEKQSLETMAKCLRSLQTRSRKLQAEHASALQGISQIEEELKELPNRFADAIGTSHLTHLQSLSYEDRINKKDWLIVNALSKSIADVEEVWVREARQACLDQQVLISVMDSIIAQVSARVSAKIKAGWESRRDKRSGYNLHTSVDNLVCWIRTDIKAAIAEKTREAVQADEMKQALRNVKRRVSEIGRAAAESSQQAETMQVQADRAVQTFVVTEKDFHEQETALHDEISLLSADIRQAERFGSIIQEEYISYWSKEMSALCSSTDPLWQLGSLVELDLSSEVLAEISSMSAGLK